VGELRALRGARAKGFTGSDIFDVLGIEVDGVDIAAGVGEARVLQAVDELAQALIRIGEGQPAAQATIGPGPTELVLEARGHDLLLTLVTLAPPARVLASGLLVDGQKMRAATLHAARGLLLDLLAISPALSGARLARRLGAECAELARGRHRPPRSRPPRDSEPQTLLSHVHRKPEKLSIQLPPETMARSRRTSDEAPSRCCAAARPASPGKGRYFFSCEICWRTPGGSSRHGRAASRPSSCPSAHTSCAGT
jgi:hypothetical protein